MTAPETRRSEPRDLPHLKRIWAESFGCDDINEFFGGFYSADLCVTADIDGAPAAAGYLLPAGDLICGASTLPCAMIYGVAALPSYRNLGLGTAVLSGLMRLGGQSGCDAVVLCPSEDSLFGYYSSRSELRDWFYITETVFSAPGRIPDSVSLKPVSAEEYGAIREKLLAGIPHVAFNGAALSYQEALCRMYGGGLFLLETGRGEACAAVEKLPDGGICVKELLTPGNCPDRDAAAALCGRFGAESCTVRSPAPSVPLNSGGTSKIRRFGMLAVISVPSLSPPPGGFAPWLGLAFD